MHRFRAHSLLIESPWPPPVSPTEPDPIQFGESPDLVIRQGEVPERIGGVVYEVGGLAVAPDEILLTVPGAARYHLIRGERIVVSPFPGADDDRITLFLLGSALAGILCQRGMLPLHGCSFLRGDGTACLVVGPQGIGKSTLAFHLFQGGVTLLSDDVATVSFGPSGEVVTWPAFPHLRLREDQFQTLPPEKRKGARFHVDKYVVPSPPVTARGGIPLGCVVELADSADGGPRFEQLRGGERLTLILRNLYRPHLLEGVASRGQLLRLALEGGRQAIVGRLHRPRGVEHLERQIDLISQIADDLQKKVKDDDESP